MLLELSDVDLFFRLHRTLMLFVNQRLKVIDQEIRTPEEFSRLAPAVRLKVRNALVENLDLIESFLKTNPPGLSKDELDIIRSWQHMVTGRFFVYREFAKYTVFISTDPPAVAYGVLALTQPFEELIDASLPALVQTVLLPFKNKIVFDGLMNCFNISLGPGIRNSLNIGFKDAKERSGIVTTLPITERSLPRKAKPVQKPVSPAEKDETLRTVVALIDQFCEEHLNEEYAVLCRKLAEKLSRKRPSPLLRGSPNSWASGIVRAIGGANFLHDKTQTPYMRATDIDHYLGTSPSTGAAKLAAIRKLLKIHPFDPEWCLPSHLDDNPLIWMLQVNGFMMDVRHAPREVQEIAFRKGLIPYIPADRESDM